MYDAILKLHKMLSISGQPPRSPTEGRDLWACFHLHSPLVACIIQNILNVQTARIKDGDEVWSVRVSLSVKPESSKSSEHSLIFPQLVFFPLFGESHSGLPLPSHSDSGFRFRTQVFFFSF